MGVAIADYEKAAVEVDLWGSLFVVKPVTKDNEDEIDDAIAGINRKAKKRDLTKHRELVEVFAEKMDVLLKPLAGGKKKPSTVIREAWDTGKLTVPQMDTFWEGVQEELAARPI
jgi:hypothetical protein